MEAVPASLKAVKPYIERATELQAKDPIVAYHCRLYALQEAMRIRANIPKEDMGFVMGLMDTLEKEKGVLGDLDSPSVLVENFAQDLFQRADDADRAGRYDMRTGKAFLVASQLIDVCKQFGELPADLAEKAKYAKWRFVEIAKATKEGRTPAPPRGIEPEEAPVTPPLEIPPPPEMPPDPTSAAPPTLPPTQDPGWQASSIFKCLRCSTSRTKKSLSPTSPPPARQSTRIRASRMPLQRPTHQ